MPSAFRFQRFLLLELHLGTFPYRSRIGSGNQRIHPKIKLPTSSEHELSSRGGP
jgi:hypothetical protein